MTGIKQPHHFHPIASEEAEDVKPWRLPFWTEKPAWLIEKEAKEEALKEEPSEAAESAEELALPTAEELENIRREAYNDGLEQGLIEGRQQGTKEGYEAGHDEGYKAAFEQGRQEGHKEGFESGEEEGKRKAQADIDTVVRRLSRVTDQLQAGVAERDRQLPEVLSQLVISLCQQVLATELSSGAASIHQFVKSALEELPSGEENIRVFVGPDDAQHLQASLDVSGDDLHYSIDEKLAAGLCRIESKHSLIEYSVEEHMRQLLDRVQGQMLQSAAGYPDESEQQLPPEPDMALTPDEATASDEVVSPDTEVQQEASLSESADDSGFANEADDAHEPE